MAHRPRKCYPRAQDAGTFPGYSAHLRVRQGFHHIHGQFRSPSTPREDTALSPWLIAGMSLSQDVWVSSGLRPSERLVPQASEQLEAEGAPRIKPGPDGHTPMTPEVPSLGREDNRSWGAVVVSDPDGQALHEGRPPESSPGRLPGLLSAQAGGKA